jgi:methyl-accepting chemotaxis protein
LIKGKEKLAQPRKKRIADEILFQVGKSVLLVFLVVAVVAILMVRWIIVSSKESELTLQSLSASHQLSGFFEQYAHGSAQLAVNPEIKQLMLETKPGDNILEAENMETVRQNLLNVQKTDAENIMAAWIADLDTSVLTQSDGYTSGDDWDITKRVWYEACVETGKSIMTEPFEDPATGQVILSAVTPVYSDTTGELLGVTGLDVSMEHLTGVMGGYKIGKNGYVLLLSSEGTIIYHPQKDMRQKNLADVDVSQNVMDAVKAGKEQYLKYKVGGTVKYGVAEPVGETGYTVISNMPFSEYYALLIQMIIILVILFVVGIVLIVLSIRKSAASLSKPIMELNHTAQQLAEGDLDVLLDIASEDEIGELGDSIGKTVARLKEYIVYIDETAEVLAQIADGKLSIELKNDYVGEFQKIKDALINISDSMNDVMKNISESSGQVSVGASELAEASQMLAEGAQAQAAAVQELARTTNTVTEQVQESRKDAEESAQGTVRVTKMMEQNQDKMKQMMGAMNEIRETSQKVVGIIQTIEEIAEQTNLLSLNASIEAARAGELGKGFAVVADEIGKLAMESSKAASTTRELIGVSMDEINKGNEIANGVMVSLEKSVSAVGKVNEMIRKTAESAATQAEHVKQIRAGIDGISQGVNDNSAVSQETYATSEQLATQTVSLNEMVQKFELQQ